ncbi:uncharacterized protein spag16 [Synchiropus picturatus]
MSVKTEHGGAGFEQEAISERDFSIKDENFRETKRKAAGSAFQIKPASSKQEIVLTTPEAVDDFLKNFLWRVGMSRTLDRFETEWYTSALHRLARNLLVTPAAGGFCYIPDAVTHRQLLEAELKTVREETAELRKEVLAAGASLRKMQKERDYHRLQFQRVFVSKHKLMEDVKTLKIHLKSYEPVLKKMDDKYQSALRNKILLTLDEDRIKNRYWHPTLHRRDKGATRGARAKTAKTHGDTEGPATDANQDQVTVLKGSAFFSRLRSITAHKFPVNGITLHPKHLILASVSDDCSWSLWRLPTSPRKEGELLQTGHGHLEWLSSCSFHPDGSKLATTSGDATVKLWDVALGNSLLTLSGHTHPVWGCSFRFCGNFLASCSTDRTAKLWDLNSQRCRLTMRHHTCTVNTVRFVPSSNTLLTCSADKTLALWDVRMGTCTTIFQGHQYPCNHAALGPPGGLMASCDTHGFIYLWDIRKPETALKTVDTGPAGASQVAFNPSGEMLAVASKDCLVRLVDVESSSVSTLSGHKDSVQSVIFDHKGEKVLSSGSDGLINMWM